MTEITRLRGCSDWLESDFVERERPEDTPTTTDSPRSTLYSYAIEV